MKTAFLLGVFTLFASPVLHAEGASRRQTGKALVAAPRLRVRRGPSVSASPMGAVTEGVPVALLEISSFTAVIDEKSAPWYKIRTLSGRFLEGWVFGGYLDVAPDPVDGVDPWLAAFCYADLKAFGETPAEASARLGPPKDTRTAEQPNRHDPSQTDRVLTLTFSSATLVMNETAYKTFLERSILTADVAGFNDLLKMGSAPRHVREMLGDPVRDDIKTMTYECGRGQNDSLLLSFTLDKLASIEWSHPAD